jgi:uncharacterized Zn finger protein
MGEPIKYQSAFATMKATGNLTKEILLKTVDEYSAILDREQIEFESAMKDAVSKTVQVNLDKIAAKESDVQKKINEIAALNTEIENLRVEMNTLQMEATANQTKIDNATRNFVTTVNVVRNEIATDKTNITNFIQ